MSTEDNSGPAFPVSVANRTDQSVMVLGHLIPPHSESTFLGLSARDYFAAKAMQAVLGAATAAGEANEPEDAEPLARAAYFMADAMLKARQQ